MDHPVVHFGTVLAAFFAIMNPLANAPVFLGLVGGLDGGQQRKVATQAVLAAFLIITAFSFGGRWIFDVFGITLPAFRIAGGVLVALVGYHMLQESSSPVQSSGDAPRTTNTLDIAISPLALPILAGPGTLTTAMNFAAESSIPEIGRVLGAAALMCASTWAAFVGGERLVTILGHAAINAISKIMGMLLTVIGVQMLIEGIRGANLALASAG